MARQSNNGRLKVLTERRIKEAYESQKEGNWDFYAERAFLENILNQNVNFIIALFALILTAAFTVGNKHNQFLIWILGVALMFIFLASSLRVTARLDVVLNILYKLGDKEVLPMIQEEVNRFKFPENIRTFKARYVGIPFIFFVIMVMGLIANWLCLFQFVECKN